MSDYPDSNDDESQFNYRNIIIKVLYKFDDNPTTFLARSNTTLRIKTADVPLSNDGKLVTLGGAELFYCINQAVEASPESFSNSLNDYAVYVTDVSEPDQPLIGYGLFSKIIENETKQIIPGRVRSNFASLFGGSGSSESLEIKIKFLKIESNSFNEPPSKKRSSPSDVSNTTKIQKNLSPSRRSHRIQEMNQEKVHEIIAQEIIPQAIEASNNSDKDTINSSRKSKDTPKISLELPPPAPKKLTPKIKNQNPSSNTRSSNQTSFTSIQPSAIMGAVILDSNFKPKSRAFERTRTNPIQKAERTQSLPNFISRVNPKTKLSQEERIARRFKDAPFNAIDENSCNKIQKKPEEDKKSSKKLEEDKKSSKKPQEDKKPKNSNEEETRDVRKRFSKRELKNNEFCINDNCKTKESIIWRLVSLEDGLKGHICNACYMFFRVRGFMRPVKVVKEYNRNKKNKNAHSSSSPAPNLADEVPKYFSEEDNDDDDDGEDDDDDEEDEKDDEDEGNNTDGINIDSSSNEKSGIDNNDKSNRKLGEIEMLRRSPRNRKTNLKTPNYNDISDIMSDLNTYGGPSTDIDPLPQYQRQQDSNSPVVATKSNTRIINLYDEDKENHNPDSLKPSPSKMSKTFNDFESMLTSFGQVSANNSPLKNLTEQLNNESLNESPTQWIQNLLNGPTPKDDTPVNANTCNTLPCETPIGLDRIDQAEEDEEEEDETHSSPFNGSPQRKKQTRNQKLKHSHMPSSPFSSINQDVSSPSQHINLLIKNAKNRLSNIDEMVAKETSPSSCFNTSPPKLATWEVMSSPQTDFYSNDDKPLSTLKRKNYGNTKEVE